jgi:predicted DCC family thiol-disulfide oxidoreductase YuxK
LFILKHDSRGELLFTANSSPYGTELLKKHGLIEESNHTIIVTNGEHVMLRSEAVLFIASHLRLPYSWFVFTRVVPRFARDLVYRLIASVRHLLARAKDVCELLPPEQLARIIER